MDTMDEIISAKKEEQLAKANALVLFDQNLLQGFRPGSIETLREIHRLLFKDVYAFAGQIRTVNLAKGTFCFASWMFLSDSLKNIEGMPQNTFDEIIEKYIELNIAHPFREGNGRAGRIWLDHLLKAQIKQVIDWSRIDREDYLSAMQKSPLFDQPLKALLKPVLSDQIRDRELYMSGIDASFFYEGFESFKTRDLQSETI